MGMILVTASVAVFVWAVVGLIRPTWARLPSRAASVGVWVLSAGCQSVPPPTPEAVAAPATDERVHPESDFQAQVQRLIQQRPLGGDTTEARAFHNDLTLTVNREASALLGVNDMRPAARSRSERLVEMVGDGRRPRCRRHDRVVAIHRRGTDTTCRVKCSQGPTCGLSAQTWRTGSSR